MKAAPKKATNHTGGGEKHGMLPRILPQKNGITKRKDFYLAAKQHEKSELL
jgi:hypothetical protein